LAGRSPSLSACLGALLLAGCVAYGPGDLRVGDDEAAVVRSMGAPAARHAMPEGVTRLVFARGPFGRHAYMVELGRDGRVLRWHQALSEAAFARIVPGMSADELLRDFGPPCRRQPLGWQPWVVWSWRFPTYDCLWFRVTLDRDQRVVDTSYGPDPLCQVDNDEIP
jgi:hypothetical protein